MEKTQVDKLIEKYGFDLEETHISWVLIGKDTVYKIKKPVNFGFLDYSSLEKRLKFCKQEIELNSRLAKDMYLGISKITKQENEISIDEEGDIIEYAVKMKKIPQDRMMDLLIRQNKIEESHINALAKIIANFHKNAETNDYILSFGSIETNKTNTDENFEQTKNAIGDYITEYQYNSIFTYTNQFYKKEENLFQHRIKTKKIKDCHGDMYSRNICIISEEEIYIYDCIEFNERFRYSDVASDVAFMLMDLENYSRYDLSDLFLKYYLEYSKDDTLYDIVTFYKIYRAYVRGKIAFFQQNKKEANNYFDLAFGYLPKQFKPKLILMSGLTGSGKSYIADRLSKSIDAVVLNSDSIRKELLGMDKFQKDLSDFQKGIYSKEITDTVYNTLKTKAYDTLKDGKNVILDATYLTKKQRNDVETFMKRLNIKPVVIFVDVDDETAKKHFQKRESQKSVSDGRFEIYIKQKEILEKPKNCIRVNPKNNINAILNEIIDNIK